MLPAGAGPASPAPAPGTLAARSGYTVDRGIPYGPDPVQLLDLYLPDPLPPGPRPVMVFLHSGGWVAGSRSNIPPFLLDAAVRMGVDVASVDYHLATTRVGTFPTAPVDVDRAIRFVEALPGVDPGRTIVAGTSAGGHLAALAAAAPGRFSDPALPARLRAQDPRVAGVIDIVGPSDLASFGAGPGWGPVLVSTFLGCHGPCPAAALRRASVAPYLRAGAPPAFFAYGARDSLVDVRTQADPLVAAWSETRSGTGGVWLGVSPTGGHNPSADTVNVTWLRAWLDGILTGRWQHRPSVG